MMLTAPEVSVISVWESESGVSDTSVLPPRVMMAQRLAGDAPAPCRRVANAFTPIILSA